MRVLYRIFMIGSATNIILVRGIRPLSRCSFGVPLGTGINYAIGF